MNKKTQTTSNYLKKQIDEFKVIVDKKDVDKKAEEIIKKIYYSDWLTYNLNLFLFKNKFSKEFSQSHIEDLKQEVLMLVCNLGNEKIVSLYNESHLKLLNYIMRIVKTKIFYRNKRKQSSYVPKIIENSGYFLPYSYDLYSSFDNEKVETDINNYLKTITMQQEQEMMKNTMEKFAEGLTHMQIIKNILDRQYRASSIEKKNINEWTFKNKMYSQVIDWGCNSCISRGLRIIWNKFMREYSEYIDALQKLKLFEELNYFVGNDSISEKITESMIQDVKKYHRSKKTASKNKDKKIEITDNEANNESPETE